MARGPRSVLLGDRQIEALHRLLSHVQKGITIGNLGEDWFGTDPEERRTYNQLLEKFTRLVEME